MKKTLIIFTFIIACIISVQAKTTTWFNEFAGQPGASYTYISPSMMMSMEESEIWARTIKASSKDLKSLEILTVLNDSEEEVMKQVKKLINKQKLETLVTRQKNNGSSSAIFGKKGKGKKHLEKLLIIEQKVGGKIEITYIVGHISLSYNPLSFY